MKSLTLETLSDYCKMFGIDEQVAIQKTNQAVAHYAGGKIAPWVDAAKRSWYDTLELEAEADYSLYDGEWYFCELLACYEVYSSRYVDLISRLHIKTESILDMGCGLGITTTHLSEKFGVDVVGTNLEDTKQYIFCQSKINVIPDHKIAGKVGMVFASEYFEHIYNAGDHLLDIIEINSPKTFVLANAFNAKSLGHFDYYYNGGWSSKPCPCDSMVAASKMGRLFSQILKAAGYSKVDTGFWNSRPNVWQRNES